MDDKIQYYDYCDSSLTINKCEHSHHYKVVSSQQEQLRPLNHIHTTASRSVWIMTSRSVWITVVNVLLLLVIPCMAINVQASSNNLTIIVAPGIDAVNNASFLQHTAEMCYNFGACASDPDDCWTTPSNISLHISRCDSDNKHIRILDINMIRPDEKGDICSSDPSCYQSSCCCYSYMRNCTASIRNTTYYWSVVSKCDNESECDVSVPSRAMEDLPDIGQYCPSLAQATCKSYNAQRISRCWARVLQVKYTCQHIVHDAVIPVDGVHPVTSTTVVKETTASPAPPPKVSLGILLGVCVPLVVFIVILLVTIVCLCRSRRKKSAAAAITSPGSEHIPLEFLTLPPQDGSTLQLCRHDNHSPSCQQHSPTQPFIVKPLPSNLHQNCDCNTIPSKMVDNALYEGRTDGDDSDDDNKKKVCENCYEGVDANNGACKGLFNVSPSASAVQNVYYDDRRVSPSGGCTNTAIQDNMENYNKEKYSINNNHHLHHQPTVVSLPSNDNQENIYETIPESFSRDDRVRSIDGDEDDGAIMTFAKPLISNWDRAMSSVRPRRDPREQTLHNTEDQHSGELQL